VAIRPGRAPGVRVAIARPGDDDPARLWWHVVCSLQRACPDLDAEDMLDELRAQVPDITRTMLPMLVNALTALPGPVVLVLDDYHVISEPDCHEQIASLLLHLPPSALVVLITRSDPPLPLARMRASGDLAEIRMRELRFTPPEAAALVRAASGIELSPPDVADLVARADGWQRGYTWPHSPCRITRHPRDSCVTSPAATGSLSTSWPRRS